MDIYPIDMEVRRDIMNDSSVYGLYTELFCLGENSSNIRGEMVWNLRQ